MGNFAENLNLGNRFRPPLDIDILISVSVDRKLAKKSEAVRLPLAP